RIVFSAFVSSTQQIIEHRGRQLALELEELLGKRSFMRAFWCEGWRENVPAGSTKFLVKFDYFSSAGIEKICNLAFLRIRQRLVLSLPQTFVQLVQPVQDHLLLLCWTKLTVVKSYFL